ncbi:MAG: DUF3343 domain-containing protein [Ruminococcaceae bacterium]|nr:DUF3343 domain-containing protein [Oscillospiraceae bacterium]
MKKEWLITFRSVTFAQKGERVLREGNISCRLQRTPKFLSERGCSYCLRLQDMDAPIAVELLRRKQAPYGKVYAIDESGKAEEQAL